MRDCIDGGFIGVISDDVRGRTFQSKLISPYVASCLMSYLPKKYIHVTPVLLFDAIQDGISFNTLWNRLFLLVF